MLPLSKEGQSLAVQVLCTMEDVLKGAALLCWRNLMGEESAAEQHHRGGALQICAQPHVLLWWFARGWHGYSGHSQRECT